MYSLLTRILLPVFDLPVEGSLGATAGTVGNVSTSKHSVLHNKRTSAAIKGSLLGLLHLH